MLILLSLFLLVVSFCEKSKMNFSTEVELLSGSLVRCGTGALVVESKMSKFQELGKRIDWLSYSRI